MENNRNLLITIVLSVIILTGWQVLYTNPKVEAQREAARIEAEQQAAQAPQPGTTTQGDADIPTPGATAGTEVPGASATAPAPVSREAAVSTGNRIRIDTPRIGGSINLAGGRLDDLLLNDYRVTVDDNSPNIQLLNPSALSDGYYAEFGFVGSATSGSVPGPDTVWTAESGATLTPDSPVTLTYTNENELTFRRTLTVDENYLFTVSDTVSNASGQPVELRSYGRTTRMGEPKTSGLFILHEGLIGVAGEKGLQEISYSDVKDDREIKPGLSNDGWVGITDKYWAVTLVPNSGVPFDPRFAYFDDGRERFQADFLTDPIVVPAQGEAKIENMVFAGAKEVHVIDNYEA